MALGLYVFWALTWLVWVLLALAPTQNTSPEWLLLTREVCFGSLPERLPSAQGWISLAAPIPMLVALLAVLGSILSSCLSHIFQAALYVYALTNEMPGGFQKEVLQGAFRA